MSAEGVIEAIGDEIEVPAAHADLPRIDLNGRTVFPGLVSNAHSIDCVASKIQISRLSLRSSLRNSGLQDAHLHVLALGKSHSILDFRGCRSIEEMVALVKSYFEEQPDLEVIVGEGWAQDNMGGRFVLELKFH